MYELRLNYTYCDLDYTGVPRKVWLKRILKLNVNISFGLFIDITVDNYVLEAVAIMIMTFAHATDLSFLIENTRTNG